MPGGAIVPGAADGIAAQSLTRAGDGGAVWAGGVAGAGGACALAAPDAAISTHKTKSECFFRMRRKRPTGTDVPGARSAISQDLR